MTADPYPIGELLEDYDPTPRIEAENEALNAAACDATTPDGAEVVRDGMGYSERSKT